MIRKNPITQFLPLIPETRNLRRFLVPGINGKNGFSLIMKKYNKIDGEGG
jgi:hypothetical protein